MTAIFDVPATVSLTHAIRKSGALSQPVRPIAPAANPMVAVLLELRATAADDIRNAKGRVDAEWLADRIAEVESCNRQLVKLGAIPA
jgi:hypothetical protein